VARRAHGRVVGLLTFLLSSAALTLSAQPGTSNSVIEAWVQRYNNIVSNAYDHTGEIVVDNAGDIIVGGGTDRGGENMLIIKYSGANGSTIWQRRREGFGRFFDVKALAASTNGDVVATGYAETAGRREQYVAKYASLDGSLLWERRYLAETNTLSTLIADVAVDKTGNIVTIGAFATTGATYKSHVAKYANDGNLLWQIPGVTNGIFAVALDTNDNVVVTGGARVGTNFNYYTAKYAAVDGSLEWENLGQGGMLVAVDQSGDVMVAGTRANPDNGTDDDYYTARLAGDDGALIWRKNYNGPANYHDRLAAAVLDRAGNVVVTGVSYTNTGLVSYYTAKYAAADGAVLWDQRSEPGEPLGPLALAVNDTNVILRTVSKTINYAADNGALIWQRIRYRFENLAVAMDRSGDVLLTGSILGPSLDDSDSYTVRLAITNGAVVWEQRYNGTANRADHAHAVALDPHGNVIVTGGSARSGGVNYYTAKYAKLNGTLLWENRSVTNEASCVAVDRDGNAIVLGFGGTVKHAAGDGRILWHKPVPPGDFVPVALGVDSGNNVVITGFVYSEGVPDFYTVKYAGINGSLLWARRYNGPAPSQEQTTALAIDSSDNVIVTGVAFKEVGSEGYTAKYRGTDGAVLWEKRNEGFAVAVALDREGNVAVAGGRGVTSDYYTAMYAAGNGTLLWQQIYDIRGYSDDVAQALTVDQDGNVIVTGRTRTASSTTGSDFYTIKYNGVNGTRLWEKRYSGTGDDDARAIGLDSRGNVVVSGTSWNGTNHDYYTAKYAAQDGALLWEQRYNGPANGNDLVGSQGLAVGSDGLIVVTGSSDALGSRGFFNIEAPDYATVAYWDGLPPVSLQMISSGVRLRLNGLPERTYEVQRALTPTGPWATIATVTAASDGTIDHIDAGQTADSAFYRIVQP
jgi:hypothetical protein